MSGFLLYARHRVFALCASNLVGTVAPFAPRSGSGKNNRTGKRAPACAAEARFGEAKARRTRPRFARPQTSTPRYSHEFLHCILTKAAQEAVAPSLQRLRDVRKNGWRAYILVE